MEGERKGGERTGKKQGLMGIKVKGSVLVGKRGEISTPPPTWRYGFAQNDGSLVKDLPFTFTTTPHSARKLGANLWEVLPHVKMSKGGSRRRHRQHHQRNYHRDEDFELPNRLAEPPGIISEQPVSASSLRRHVAAIMMKHQNRNAHALQPVSPASYSSSEEVDAYNPAVTPSSSLDFKGRTGEASYSLKTSTELLKVLNRLWSLEEQHASNISLMKALKRELDHSRAEIKDLLREKTRDRQEMDDLMKQIAKDKAVMLNKEQDRMKDAVQSVRNELQDERKLREHSETLHRKLARELSEVKSSFSNAKKQLERERGARILLEKLCDEFAKGIRDYEREVRLLKQKPEKDRVTREQSDRLILHISEAWLDERMQMKLAESRCDLVEKNTIVEKLGFEIESFLQAKQSGYSLVSSQLNEAVSFPHNGDYEEMSNGTGSHCFELNRGVPGERSNFHKLGTNKVTQEILRHDNLVRNQDSFDRSTSSGKVSGLQQQMTRFTAPDIKQNTLKSKLLEARLKGQNSRLKTSEGGSF